MTELYLLTRVTHVLLGAFWVGSVTFAAFFLMPSVAEAGPDGAKVMAGLIRRKFLNVIPAVAIVNVVSGLWLYWRYTAGFDPKLSGTPGAMIFGTGGILAIIALHIGLLAMRRNVIKAGALTAKAGALPDGAEKAALMAEAMARRTRAMRAGPVVAVMLLITTALMALGHYV
jgi:uncharacterized membrane protein